MVLATALSDAVGQRASRGDLLDGCSPVSWCFVDRILSVLSRLTLSFSFFPNESSTVSPSCSSSSPSIDLLSCLSFQSLITFLTILLTISFLLIIHHHYNPKMTHPHSTTFPFMSLPPELRDMVYENLLEDPCYPPPPRSSPDSPSLFNFLMPGRSTQRGSGGGAKRSNWILLASKQCYAEFIDVLVKKTTFHLTVSPANYWAVDAVAANTSIATTEKDGSGLTLPFTTSTSTPTTPISSLATFTPPRLFNISLSTLHRIRRCSIKLITTSSMLGVPDPRNMPPSSWALATHLKSELSSVRNVEELNLHVKAIGDPLWNPLWVWYHASQSFKDMGNPCPTPSSTTTTSEKSFSGPKLDRITFSLDTWSPGENHLARSQQDDRAWAWYCTKDHQVALDGGADVTVREFCARLYMECRTCRPELESEDEAQDEDDDDDDDDEE
jgi:hypothetical protein